MLLICLKLYFCGTITITYNLSESFISEVIGFVLRVSGTVCSARVQAQDVNPQGQEEDQGGQEEGEARAGHLGHVDSQGLLPQL